MKKPWGEPKVRYNKDMGPPDPRVPFTTKLQRARTQATERAAKRREAKEAQWKEAGFRPKLANKLAYLIRAWEFFRDHKTVTRVLVVSVVLFVITPGIAGSIIRVAFGFMYAIFFMVVQFGALFWFISQVRTTKILPGSGYAVTFADYWGQPHLVKVMEEWMALLKDRGKFVQMGGQPPKGMLLSGAPGTGKTWLAKCMAGSAGVPFVGMEGSGFRGMFWGMDVLRVMSFTGQLRKLADEYGACIGFLDEIDAVGASRGGGQGGQQPVGIMGGGGGGALNRLLSEIDGFGEYSGMDQARNKARRLLRLPPKRLGYVLFIGATNRPDVLDVALTRPGRLGKHIPVDPPDKTGRRAIIEGYLAKVRHADDVNVEYLVDNLSEATPAQIKDGIVTDAIRIAYFQDRDVVTQRDIEDGLWEQTIGIANPINDWEPEQESVTALHEAGHAVIQYILVKKERIARLSIVRRSGFLGFMSPRAITDLYVQSRTEITNDIKVSLGGLAATKVVYGEGGEWGGASSDLDNVYFNLKGMTANGFFGPEAQIRAINAMTSSWEDTGDVQEKFIIRCMGETEALLQANLGMLLALRDVLIERKEMPGEEVIAILNKYPTVLPTTEDTDA